MQWIWAFTVFTLTTTTAIKGEYIHLTRRLSYEIHPSAEVRDDTTVWVDRNDYILPSNEPIVPWDLDRIDQPVGLDGRFDLPVGYNGNQTDLYIVDTGVQANDSTFHPGQVLEGYSAFNDSAANEDCQGHGTQVASVAAGMVFGIAHQATIVPVKMMNCRGLGRVADFVDAVNWMRDRIRANPQRKHVINLSFQLNVLNVVVNRLIDELTMEGALVIVAAGNGHGQDACGVSPSSALSAIAVGATTMDDIPTEFSNNGTCVRVWAPGKDVVTTLGLVSGTSMSSAIVSGVVACLWSLRVQLTTGQMSHLLLNRFVVRLPLPFIQLVGQTDPPVNVQTRRPTSWPGRRTKRTRGL